MLCERCGKDRPLKPVSVRERPKPINLCRPCHQNLKAFAAMQNKKKNEVMIHA